MLWNKNFSLLIAANTLLFIGVYMLFPMFYRWITNDWGCSESQAALLVAAFVPAMFLPGMFNNYLVDTFSRKHVCTRSVIGLAAAGVVSPYVPELWMAVLLWMVQGALFGIALMANGSTLVIDVTPSHKRNEANRVFSWSGLLGTLGGLLIGVCGTDYLGIPQLLYLSSGLCLGAAFLVSMVSVCFRAPLDLPLCSLDRFFLFRTLFPGVMLALVGFALGSLVFAIPSQFFYLSLAGGFAIYLIIREVFTAPMNGRLQILLGQVLTLFGISVLLASDRGVELYGGGLLVGLGTGFSLGQCLRMMILLPMHCERGTGFHTFQLLWHLGFILGISAAAIEEDLYAGWLPWETYGVAAVVSGVSLLLYQLLVHSYFIRHWQEH